MASSPDKSSQANGALDGTNMASQSTPPAQEHQMPDCIIASSNRFNDVRPYCDRLYFTEPKKWGEIMPWEYPYKPTDRQQEDDFLRKWFSETEIHMQGGAQGDGNGFRFLKQVWISIALYNWETRMPAIAQWWLQQPENQGVLADPAMMKHLCSPDATPATFFQSSEIELYGTKLLRLVVRQIQEIVKVATTGDASTTSESFPVPGAKVNGDGEESATITPLPDTLTPPEGKPNGPRTDSIPIVSPPAPTQTGSGPTIPFPAYSEPTMSGHHSGPGVYAQPPASQPYGRKRGMSNSKHLGSGGGGRYNGRQQSAALNLHSAQLPYPNFDPALANFSNFGYNPPQSQAHLHAGGPPVPASVQPYLPPDISYGLAAPEEMHVQQNVRAFASSAPNQADFHNGRGPVQYTGGVSRDRRDFSDESVSSAFDVYTAGYSHNRRGSQGSRGGGQRGQGRSGRGRGRGRGSFSDTTGSAETYAAGLASNDYSAPMSYNHRGRRGDASKMAGWRSNSDRPQGENILPARQLSNPAWPHSGDPQSFFQSMTIQPFDPQAGSSWQGVPRQASASQVATFITPSGNYSMGSESTVNARHIGENDRHVNRLIFFNIPRSETTANIEDNIGRLCSVEVIGVSRPNATQFSMGRDDFVHVHVTLPSHHAARHVLALSDVKLYGRPLKVEVPHEFWNPSYQPHHVAQSFGRPPLHQTFQASGMFDPGVMSFTPAQNADTTSPPPNVGPKYDLQSPQDARVDPDVTGYQGGSFSGPKSGRGVGFEMVPLSTIHSVNTTPTASGTNTPKKKKKNKSKAARKEDKATLQMPSIKTPAEASQNELTGRNTGEVMPELQVRHLSSEDQIGTMAAESKVLDDRLAQSSGPTSSQIGLVTQSEEASQKPAPAKVERERDETARAKVPAESTTSTPNTTTVSYDQPDRSDPQPAPAVTKSDSEQADDSFHTAHGTPPSTTAHNDPSSSTSHRTGGRTTDAKVATPTRLLKKPEATIKIPQSADKDTKTSQPAADEQDTAAPIAQLLVPVRPEQPASGTADNQTASTAPDPPQTGELPKAQPASKDNAADQKAAKSKASEKQKGPATTESFSVFGKKRGKKIKAAKAPKSTARPSGEEKAHLDQQQDAQSAGKSHASQKTEGSIASTEPSTSNDPLAPQVGSKDDPQPTPPSSPSKRSFASLLSFLPGMTTKTPSNTSRSVKSEVFSEPELTDSKVQAAQPLVASSTETALTDKVQVSGTKRSNDAAPQIPSVDITEAKTAAHEPQGHESAVAKMPEASDDHNDTAAVKAGDASAADRSDSDQPVKKNKKKKPKPKKKKKSNQRAVQDGTGSSNGDSIQGDQPTLTITTAGSASEVNETESDRASESSSHTLGRPTPPVSPPAHRLTTLKKAGPDHIITAPPPRNQHVKCISSSRLASESSGQATNESKETTGLVVYRKSEIGRRVGQMLHLYTIQDASQSKPQMEGEDGGKQTDQTEKPQVAYVLINLPDDTPAEPLLMRIFQPLEGLNFGRDGDEGEGKVFGEVEETEAETEAPEASSTGTTEVDSEMVHSDE